MGDPRSLTDSIYVLVRCKATSADGEAYVSLKHSGGYGKVGTLDYAFSNKIDADNYLKDSNLSHW